MVAENGFKQVKINYLAVVKILRLTIPVVLSVELDTRRSITIFPLGGSQPSKTLLFAKMPLMWLIFPIKTHQNTNQKAIKNTIGQVQDGTM